MWKGGIKSGWMQDGMWIGQCSVGDRGGMWMIEMKFGWKQDGMWIGQCSVDDREVECGWQGDDCGYQWNGMRTAGWWNEEGRGCEFQVNEPTLVGSIHFMLYLYNPLRHVTALAVTHEWLYRRIRALGRISVIDNTIYMVLSTDVHSEYSGRTNIYIIYLIYMMAI